MCRAKARPPGQANAQNGGSTLRSASQASVACHIGVISDGEVQTDFRHLWRGGKHRVGNDERRGFGQTSGR